MTLCGLDPVGGQARQIFPSLYPGERPISKEMNDDLKFAKNDKIFPLAS